MSLWNRLRTAISPTPSSRPRRLHLGIDFGTCWSKLVVRDYEANTPRAFVVRVPAAGKTAPSFRIPSSVTLLAGRLHFGWEGDALGSRKGAVVYRSVKMRAAFSDAAEYSRLPELPVRLTAGDMAALVVTYLLQIGGNAGQSYVSALSGGPFAPRIGMTIGVPMGLGQHQVLRDQFVAIARTAFDLYHAGAPPLENGIDLDEVLSLLAESKERLGRKGPVSHPREWIRSEAEAGLVWVFNSPRVSPGLYACIDVGAGTTDVSVFRIVQQFEESQWVKGKLAFYSAGSGLPGVDAIDTELQSLLRSPVGMLRGQEDDLITRNGLVTAPEIQEVVTRMFEVYRQAWSEGYGKERRQAVWHSFGLFVLGGGSRIGSVVDALSKSPWQGQLEDRSPHAHDRPEDLFELPRGRRGLQPFEGDGTFLLVAYGLSFLCGDVPVSDSPDDVKAFEPSRTVRSIDQDEYYPK